MPRANVAVLGSNQGRSFQQMMLRYGEVLPVDIALVLSNRHNAPLLDYANKAGIATQTLVSKGIDSEGYGNKLHKLLMQHRIDYLLLVGFMRILGPTFTERWHRRIINLHPSLLPRYKGLMDLSVHQAVLDNQEKETGCSVHYVTDKVDEGPILLQKTCQVMETDTVNTLKEKVQALEAEALYEALDILAKRVRHE